MKLEDTTRHPSPESQNVRILRKIHGRVDVKLYYLGILCILRFSSLSIEECHNIQPCKRALRPSQNRTCGFPTSGSSAKLTLRATVCKHTIHAIRSVPAKAIIASLPSPLRYEGNIASVMLSISVYGIRYSSLYVLLLTPSSVPNSLDSMSITPFTPLLRVSPTAISPYFLLRLFDLLEASLLGTIWLSQVPL